MMTQQTAHTKLRFFSCLPACLPAFITHLCDEYLADKIGRERERERERDREKQKKCKFQKKRSTFLESDAAGWRFFVLFRSVNRLSADSRVLVNYFAYFRWIFYMTLCWMTFFWKCMPLIWSRNVDFFTSIAAIILVSSDMKKLKKKHVWVQPQLHYRITNVQPSLHP